MKLSHVEIDGDRVEKSVHTDVKVIVIDDDGFEHHVTITHEGMILDLIQEGTVIDSCFIERFDFGDLPERIEDNE